MKYLLNFTFLVLIPHLFYAMEKPLTDLEREFFFATDKGDIETVKSCITRGVNINVIDSGEFGNETPLARALMWGHYEIALHLLSQKNIDVNHVSKTAAWRQTQLHGIFECHAARRFSSSQKNTLAKLLLERGANPNAKDIDGDTPLHCALKDHDTRALKESVELLVDAGACMSPNKKYQTPLHLAVVKHLPDHLYILLKSQELTLQDIRNRTSNASCYYSSYLEILAKRILDYLDTFASESTMRRRLSDEIIPQMEVTTNFKKLTELHEKTQRHDKRNTQCLSSTTRSYRQ